MGGIKILVAEDEPAERRILMQALTRAGYSVASVADGQAAVEALHRDRYDLLIADIMMPVLDGIGLALMATQDDPDLRVLLVTGYPAQAERARNLDALAHGVLAKPYTLPDLLAAAQAALAWRPAA